jgi:hypothetical protein
VIEENALRAMSAEERAELHHLLVSTPSCRRWNATTAGGRNWC